MARTEIDRELRSKEATESFIKSCESTIENKWLSLVESGYINSRVRESSGSGSRACSQPTKSPGSLDLEIEAKEDRIKYGGSLITRGTSSISRTASSKGWTTDRPF